MSEKVVTSKPLITVATAMYYAKENDLRRKVILNRTTKGMVSILRIWYVLAEMYAKAVKLRKEPTVSRMAGPRNSKGLALFFS